MFTLADLENIVASRATATDGSSYTAKLVADLLAASAVATGAATTVLEVAAGQAPYGRACSARGMEVTALDLPPVIDRLRSAESRESAGDGAARLRLVAGNVFDVDLRDRYDAVIVAGFCRLHGAEANQRLFERCRSWLQPGGRLVVVDAVASPDATRRGLGLYALGLATRAGSGRVHGVEDYRSWFARAGCGPVRVHEMDRPELTVMWATRSAEAHREG